MDSLSDIMLVNIPKTHENNQKSVAKVKTQLNPKISIVLPCYNEGATISHVISNILILGLENYEIIVIDDGSNDNSFEIMKEMKEVNPFLKVFKHSKNLGYGKTILDGIFHASGDLIITIDSDGQHDPADIPKLCAPILNGECDFVIGSRYLGEYYYQIPLLKRTGEAFIESLILLLFKKRVVNNQGGFRVFNRKILPILHSIEYFGMAMTTEILIKALISGLRVKEVGIRLKDRPYGFSNQKLIPLFFNVIICCMKNWIRRPI